MPQDAQQSVIQELAIGKAQLEVDLLFAQAKIRELEGKLADQESAGPSV